MRLLGHLVAIFALLVSAISHAQTPLEGTYWRLNSIDGTVVESKDLATLPHIALHAEGSRIAGFSGCNRFFARYELDGQALRITPMGGGRSKCPDAVVAEPEFLQHMAATASFRIDGETLTLSAENGGKLVFRAVAE